MKYLFYVVLIACLIFIGFMQGRYFYKTEVNERAKKEVLIRSLSDFEIKRLDYIINDNTGELQTSIEFSK